jgi:uroporphyrinogen decarboxylase
MPAPMTSRERMLAAMRHQPYDRVPTDIWCTPEVTRKLEAHFGPGVDWRAALHLDGMGGIHVPYIGPALPALPPGESADFWGMRRRRIDYGTGAYDEQYFHPLAACRTIDDLNRYAWPSADWFDYSTLAAQGARARQTQVVQCGYMAPLYYHNLLRGLEPSLMDPYDDPQFTHELVGRVSRFFLDYHRRVFAAAGGTIDVAQVTDDLGTQAGPLISLEVFRTFYRPPMQAMIDLCREFGITVMHHDDGAMRGFLPDLIEMGIQILNPIQWRCPGMEVEGLKQDFGGKLCFHGGIDNQETLPHGTPAQVRAEVRHMIDVLAADGTGYILAPCHNIQPVTPLENILALYDEAHRYGARG